MNKNLNLKLILMLLIVSKFNFFLYISVNVLDTVKTLCKINKSLFEIYFIDKESLMYYLPMSR